MASGKLRFAIFGNTYQVKKSSSIQKIISCLSGYDAEVYIDREYYNFLMSTGSVGVSPARVFDGDGFDADFVISMGGDGTFLKAAGRVAEKEIPIVGVNMGRLGFLADVCPSEIDECICSLYSGDYMIDSRKAIQVSADADMSFCGPACALNDVAILKRDSASMISIHTSIDGEYLTTYQADGLIVSTPTGSTAYSLSNGGPVIAPGTNVFLLTAVAPHSLNTRPIVISDASEIRLDVESRSHNFLVAIDGRSMKCGEGTGLTLRRAPYSVNIVKRSGQKFFKTIREKMMWGADSRTV